jgi:hypothetical protein
MKPYTPGPSPTLKDCIPFTVCLVSSMVAMSYVFSFMEKQQGKAGIGKGRDV